MRISDLSSDVCSFDLIASSRPLTQVALRAIAALQGLAETLRQKDGVQMGETLEITFHGAARTVTGSCMQLRYGDLAVLIYFDLDTKRDIPSRMQQVTASDGYLLLGSTETNLDMETHRERDGDRKSSRLNPSH